MDFATPALSVGAVFISKDNTVIVIEEAYADHVVFRYVVTDSPKHLGKVDWAFVANLCDGRWERLA